MKRRQFFGIFPAISFLGLPLVNLKEDKYNLNSSSSLKNASSKLVIDYVLVAQAVGAVGSFVFSQISSRKSRKNQEKMLEYLAIIIEQNKMILTQLNQISKKIDVIKEYIETQLPQDILNVFINNELEAQVQAYNSNLENLKSNSNNGKLSIKRIFKQNKELHQRISTNLTEVRNLRRKLSLTGENFSYANIIPISKTFDIENELSIILGVEQSVYQQDIKDYSNFFNFALDNKTVGLIKEHKELFESSKKYPSDGLPKLTFDEWGYRTRNTSPITFGFEKELERFNQPHYDELLKLGYITEQHRLYKMKVNDLKMNSRLLFGTPPPESLNTYGLCNSDHGPECSNVKFVLEKRIKEYKTQRIPQHQARNDSHNADLLKLCYYSHLIQLAKDSREICNGILITQNKYT